MRQARVASAPEAVQLEHTAQCASRIARQWPVDGGVHYSVRAFTTGALTTRPPYFGGCSDTEPSSLSVQ